MILRLSFNSLLGSFCRFSYAKRENLNQAGQLWFPNERAANTHLPFSTEVS